MLSDILLEPHYNSSDNNLSEDFYNKVLKEAIVYNRVSAYFSSKGIANVIKGIEGIYFNSGKIRLIISNNIDEEEFNLIKKGYEDRELYMKMVDNFDSDNNFLSLEDKVNLSNLAFLIEKNLVEIKMVFKTEGIFHDKFGIVMDKDNNEVYFRGSNNETYAALKKNYESFDVSCSWLASDFEKKRIAIANDEFEKIWNNKMNDLLVFDMPEVIKNKLISYSEGKIINNLYNFDDYIIFDYENENKKFYARLGRNIKINEKSFIYKVEIKNYVKAIKDNEILFLDNISYLNYNKIINSFKEYSDDEIKKDNITKVLVSQRLINYINEVDFKIKDRCLLGEAIKEENIINRTEIDNSFKEFCEVLNNSMERKLKKKQLWNAFHIVKMKKSANFSVPGSGKTSIVYGAFAYLNKINKIDKLLVVGPKSSFSSWKNEFKLNFGNYKKMNVCDVQSTTNEEFLQKTVNANLILVNYEALPGLKKDIRRIINSKTLLVFDEVHKIKGIGKVRANAALEISENAIYKVVLTGTPIPNGYEDLYNMLNILYRDEYNDYFGFSEKQLKSNVFKDVENINNKIYPFFCRTTKKDLSVPLPDEDELLVGYSTEEEKNLYDIIKLKYKSDPFIYYIRMMQAMSNPRLLLKSIEVSDVKNLFTIDNDENNEQIDFDYNRIDRLDNFNDIDVINLIKQIGDSSKFKRGIDKIKELVKEKKSVLVWGIFTDTLDRIHEILEENGIKSKVICGYISDLSEREKIIKQFLNKEIDVLIANPNTLAESVSLHSVCHDSIYFEYSFNYTHMAQSRDRINRLGLDKDQYTRYYYCVCDNQDNDSVDMIIYNRLKEKDRVMIEAIENGELKSFKENLTDEILKLLKD